MDVAAPGFDKKHFQIAADEHLLTVVAKPSPADNSASYRQQEFAPKAFERRYELRKSIDTNTIEAQYENGVLRIKLPKKESIRTHKKEIVIQ